MKSDLYSKSRLNFVTLFPSAESVHLSKDVGQIPYIFAKEFGAKSLLVTESDDAFGDIERRTPGLSVLRLNRNLCVRGMRVSAFHYLWRESKSIDVLNLYHLSLETKLLSLLFRIRNPKGFLYVKLDVNVANETAALSERPRRNFIRRKLGELFHSAFYRSVTMFSAESRQAAEIVKYRYPAMQTKLLEITNGLEVPVLPHSVETTMASKQNLIVTVGRIGTYQKNNELLLDALKKVDLRDWKVAIVGPYTEAFAQAFGEFLKEFPHLRNAVSLIGNVSDRKELMGWYAKARIFALTSRWEGFPLVFAEAQCYGNFIVSTDISSAAEVMEDGMFGRIVQNDDAMALAEAFQNVIHKQICSDALLRQIASWGRTRYDWHEILLPLKKAIDEHFNV
jgi:glycosyltransferase involved in cell wall biosynthesis